jgi:hypothetical protein
MQELHESIWHAKTLRSFVCVAFAFTFVIDEEEKSRATCLPILQQPAVFRNAYILWQLTPFKRSISTPSFVAGAQFLLLSAHQRAVH